MIRLAAFVSITLFAIPASAAPWTARVATVEGRKYGARLKPGAQLSIFEFESRFVGTIHAVIPSINPRAQTFELRLYIPRKSRASSTLGQLVTVAIPMGSNAPKTRAIAIPRDALILRQAGAYVFRINAEDTAERIEVEVEDETTSILRVSPRRGR